MASLTELQNIAITIREQFRDFESAQRCEPWSRKDLVLGFIGDVGALAKLTMAADGVRSIPDYHEKLGHEMADCLWSLLVLAREYKVDLEGEFMRMTGDLSSKLP